MTERRTIFSLSWLKNSSCLTVMGVLVSGAALALSFAGLSAGLPFDAAWAAIALCGAPIVAGAARALVREHDVKADLLVSMAIIASILIKEYFAAGEVALIMQVGTLLEDFTAGRARSGIEKLVKLTPQTARVKRGGASVVVPADEAAAGDTLIVLAGETIPADGVITAGETTVDQSVMTGESLPVDKKAGDEVTSGTLNQFGTFEMKASRTCGDSSLQRMVRLAREADANKAPIVRLADKWAAWMVGGAFSIALAAWLATGQAIRAVTVLVVFCPCAFVLATPTAVMAGIACAARSGVLVRSGDALERLSRIKFAAFDKTGTLTFGRPQVTGVVSCQPQLDADGLLRLTALAEQRSEHPLGRAIAEYYAGRGGAFGAAENFQVLAGRGVAATVAGHAVLAGKPGLFEAAGIALPEALRQQAAAFTARGATVVCAAVDGAAAGLVALADEPRSEAAEMVAQLKEAGVVPLLLTGDNEAAARCAAARLGIGQVRADLLPEQKMAVIKEYADRNEPICMVGDGVNDALALGAASAGIAMGGVGSDIAVESSDAVLVNDDIRKLPYLFSLTKKVMKKINQNIVISLAINLAAVTLSVLGLLNPVTGALLHNCGSVFVVLNAALLMRDGGSRRSIAAAAPIPPAPR